jgi:biopolymer transport protein ExbD
MAHQPTKKNYSLKGKKRGEMVKLNITSMMDMFTIILVFLLKSYSAEGNLVTQTKGLTLPKSSIEKRVKMSLNLAISKTHILLEDKPVVSTPELLAMIKQEPHNYIISSLFNQLEERAELAKKMEADYGTPFSAEVTVQIDQDVPFELLTRILYTCGRAAWSNMKLAVYMPGE